MVMLTWNLLVGSLWLGYSGRPWFFYGGVAAGIVLLVAVLVAVGIFSDTSDSDSRFVLAMLHWIPWLLAAAFVCKAWAAVWVLMKASRAGLVSLRAIVGYLVFWGVSTGCLLLLSAFISPRIEWLRYSLYLAALLAVPLVRVQAASLAVAWNRHR